MYRYEGEEPKEVQSETNNISELLKRIEENKRRRAAIKSELQDVAPKNDVKGSRKKTRRHLSVANEIDSRIGNKNKSNEEINEQTEAVEAPRKKKRRKKDIESADHSTMEENEQLEKNHETSIKKESSSENNFVVLGAKSRRKQHEVKRVLPDWLARPEIISADLRSGPSVEEFDSVLDTKLIELLKINGIAKLFPVQSNVIKWLHKCNKDRKLGWWLRDTCVSAPTGSGRYICKQHTCIDYVHCNY